jgi:hypothetical protein
MYEPHPILLQPDQPSVKVWRYMDFTKLVSLIDSRRLFFPRTDQLGDPFEGSWPRINVHGRKLDGPPERLQQLSKVMARWPKYAAINC